MPYCVGCVFHRESLGCLSSNQYENHQIRSQSPRYPCPAERETDKGNEGSGNEIVKPPISVWIPIFDS